MIGSPSRTAPPRPAEIDTPAPLWIWHGLDRAGRWLPDALLAGVGHVEPLIEPFSQGGAHCKVVQDWAGVPAREGDEVRLHKLLHTTRALSQAVHGCDAAVLRSMANAPDAKQARHLILCLSDSACRLADRLAGWPQAVPATALVQRDRAISYQLSIAEQTLSNAGAQVHRLDLDVLAQAGADAAEWQALWTFLGQQRKPQATATWVARWQPRLRAEIEANHAALDATSRELVGREALWTAGLQLPPAALKPVIRAEYGPQRPITLTKIDRLPALLLEGDALRLAGAVVPAAAAPADVTLWMRQGDRCEPLAWGEASPLIANRLPDRPSAAKARFQAVTVRASRRNPVSVECRPGAGIAPLPVAQVAFEPAQRAPIEGIFIAPWSIGYQPIPKVACTSIKEMLFEMTVGQPFSTALSEGARHVHTYFTQRHRDVSAASFRFIVVRDPIKRFLSAYGSRVVRHKELSREKIAHVQIDPPLDLETFPYDPDLPTFVEKFDLYRRIPTIAHHCRPINEFCAPLSAFDRVYRFEELRELVADLRRLSGCSEAKLPHSQRSSRIQMDQVSPRIFDKLVDYYAADYDMLAGLYSPAALR